MRIFPFLDDDGIINGLKAELPAYLAATADVVISTEVRKVKRQGTAPSLGICSEESAVGASILGCSRRGIFYSQFRIQRSTRARLSSLSASKCDDPVQQAMINF